jgi:hypoxia up-regulated 1
VDRVTKPIQDALKDANVTLDQLESVILHGGSVRVPFVQKVIEDKVGSSKIAKTVNADEGAVMGLHACDGANSRRDFQGSAVR